MSLRASSRGFTLIELVVTLAIIGLLAGMAVPTAELVVKRDREHDLRLALRDIRKAIDAYKQAYDEGRMIKNLGDSGYPASLNVLVEGVIDAKNPDKAKMYFLRRVPRDPMVNDAAIPAEQTWGLRSYESDADDPQEGKDVFDIYSKSADTGLNGIPYKEW